MEASTQKNRFYRFQLISVWVEMWRRWDSDDRHEIALKNTDEPEQPVNPSKTVKLQLGKKMDENKCMKDPIKQWKGNMQQCDSFIAASPLIYPVLAPHPIPPLPSLP